MRTSKLFFLLAICVSSISLFNCGGGEDEDPQPPASLDKRITKFELTSLNPTVEGVINHDNGTIKVTLPMGTTEMNYAPRLTHATDVTVSPASNVSQDFSKPVVYTVTGTDGTTKQYTVTTVVSQKASFTAQIVTEEITQYEASILINGGPFINFTDGHVVLKNVTTNETHSLDIDATTADRVSIWVPVNGVPVASYKATLHLGTESFEMPETLVVERNKPTITGYNKSSVAAGENIIVQGKYFGNSGHSISLLGGGGSGMNPQGIVVSESSTAIEMTIPFNLAPGEYNISLSVTIDGVWYVIPGIGKFTVTAASTLPQITAINKASFSRGETITITGKNLKKAGFATNINFMPEAGGVTIVKSGVANAEGTQVTYTIPNDFPLNTYIIAVEVDWDYSDDYSQAIQIKL